VKTASGERTPRIVTGVIVTGDAFVASAAKKDALRKKFKGDATEMEGAALAQICWQRRVPCLILRSLSDSAGTKAQENVLLFEKEHCPECSVARYQYCRASRSAMSTRHNARAVQWD
jgi:adenosylhomocysteine nucleosidase